MKKFLSIFLLILLVINPTFSQQDIYSRVVVSVSKEQMSKLAQSGIAIEGYFNASGFVCELSAQDLTRIKEAGFSYSVIIDDLTTYYKSQNDIFIKNPELIKAKTQYCDNFQYPTPAGFSLGSMGGYYTYDELTAKLDSFHNHYPQLISQKQAVDTFNTIEGRPVYWMRISDNPNITQNKPKVLYLALMHAREPASMQQLIFYMCYLLENYNINSHITNIINNFELYFIPCLNPDGYIYNEINEPNGGGMWRKNRRDNNNGSYGVDLNRNFGYMWGYDNQGSSSDPSVDTYRGASPFSEPETRLLKSICEQFDFKTVLNCHTYSNLLLYPWSYHPQLQNPDSSTFKLFSSIMTEKNKYKTGTGYDVLGYLANGDCIDWMYGEQLTKPKIIAFTPEIGSPAYGFWPPMNEIENICKENIHQNIHAAFLSGKYAHVKDLTSNILSSHQNMIKFMIQNAGLDSIASFTVSLVPQTANILSTGQAKVYSNLAHLQSQNDSITLTLNSNVMPGDTVKVILAIDNGIFIYSDTLTKIFGNEVVVFADDCSSLNNWSTNGWGISTYHFSSSPASITDSPNGNYQTNSNKSISLQQLVDLSGALYAELNFKTKYDIAGGYDYVQLTISNDNGFTWYPLCGKFTVNSGITSIEGEPAYEGREQNWVNEVISLENYIGQSIKFKFTLKSDWYPWTKPDGFYFDDFIVRIIDTTVISNSDNVLTLEKSFDLFPNPASDILNVVFKNKNIYEKFSFIVYDAKGRSIYEKENNLASSTVDISAWKKGVYIFKITTFERSVFKKFIKI